MSEEDQADHHEERPDKDHKDVSKPESRRKGIHLDEVKAEARKKTRAAAEAEGMSIEKYEDVENAIKDGRKEDYTDEELEVVERIQETLRAQTLSQLQELSSKPWLQASAASGLFQNTFSREMSTIMQNLPDALASKGNLSAFQSAIAAASLPKVTVVTKTAQALLNMEAHGHVLPGATSTLMESIKWLQSVARDALTAGFATRTQEFLSGDAKLRYRWNHPVWHYTNGHALLSILRNGELWASSPENLNDSSELWHGFKIIREALNERVRETKKQNHEPTDWPGVLSNVLDKRYVRSIINEVYIISASAEKDSLTLWRNYADGDGFALGINASIELSADGIAVDEAENADSIRSDVPLISGWYRVSYKDNEKRNLARSFVENAREDIRRTPEESRPDLIPELRKQAVILASVMKHDAFQDEKEVRWITTNFTTFDPVHYEHGRRSIVPVLHIRTSAEEKELLPLKGLRCSPIPDESIVRTMKGLLKQRGYERASSNVDQSQQPFKG